MYCRVTSFCSLKEATTMSLVLPASTIEKLGGHLGTKEQ